MLARVDDRPLTLAAKIGCERMFQHLLKNEEHTMWVYNPIKCVGHPLKHLDSHRFYADDKAPDRQGAVEIMCDMR